MRNEDDDEQENCPILITSEELNSDESNELENAPDCYFSNDDENEESTQEE